MGSFDIFDIIDKCISRPNEKVSKIPLWALKTCFALLCVASASHLVFGAWFIHEAGVVYKIMTLIIAFALSIAFFYESDGRYWKKFARLCIICAIPRVFFWPIYTVAKQTSEINGTDLLEVFNHEDFLRFHMDNDTLRSIWYVNYYNFIIVISTIQRASLRIAIERKKQKIYAENLKVEEAKRSEIEQAAGPVHI